METIVQISLEVAGIDEVLAIGETAHQAGANWFEAGAHFIPAGGLRGVRALRERFPDVPAGGVVQ